MKYKVQRGDTLLSLADQNQLDPQQILEANLGVNRLYPGMDINLPDPIGKIVSNVGQAFSNIGNYFGNMWGQQPSAPSLNAFQELSFLNQPPPAAGPAPALPGPRIEQQPTTIPAPVMAQAYGVGGALIRNALSKAWNAEAPYPQTVSLADMRMAYPGWTSEKMAQVMADAGYTYDAKTQSYVQKGGKAGVDTSLPGEVGDVIPYGKAGEIVKTGESSGYIRRYSSGRAADYGKRGQKWKVVNGITMPDIGRGARKRRNREARGETVGQQRAAAQAAEEPPAYNGPAGSVGLVWRVGV